MFICSGILFNLESPRRGINFVTNKVVVESYNNVDGGTTALINFPMVTVQIFGGKNV